MCIRDRIGLGADMENKANTIFSASAETGGANYHAPRAEDIQQAVDSILLEQLNIKKTTAAVVDADGGTEELDITIPTANATNARLLFISDSPIRNLNADFSAGSVPVSYTHLIFWIVFHFRLGWSWRIFLIRSACTQLSIRRKASQASVTRW